jgi:hypothetical protein
VVFEAFRSHENPRLRLRRAPCRDGYSFAKRHGKSNSAIGCNPRESRHFCNLARVRAQTAFTADSSRSLNGPSNLFGRSGTLEYAVMRPADEPISGIRIEMCGISKAPAITLYFDGGVEVKIFNITGLGVATNLCSPSNLPQFILYCAMPSSGAIESMRNLEPVGVR